MVDDDPDLLLITVRILKQEHYIVTAATTGQECLQAVRLKKPDLLLLDVMLPDISGNVVCQTIKSDPALSAIYILLLSGMKIESDNISEGLESGADGYLIKPLKPRELLARVDAAFRTIRAEKTLAQNRDMLVNLARMVPGVIYQYRLYPDGRSAFPYSSPGMNDIYEVTPEEVREDATAVFGRLHPEDYDNVAKLIQESAITLQTFYCEFRVILPRQGLRWRWSQAQPERMEDGGTLWHGVILDVTRRKLAEEALKEALVKAESGNRLKTAFMNNISHEIRTPLNGILGFSQLIIEPNLSDDEKQQFFTHIKNSSNRLINTITSYVDISLIASGNLDVNHKPIDMVILLHQLYEQFQTLCSVKNLILHLNIPETVKKIIFYSDYELCHKVLSNLLDNAIKFTSKGEITFGYTIKPGLLEFFVKDTGIGISKDAQHRIFESFVQEEVSHSRGFDGSGLGLSITQGILQLLGGGIRVESEKGRGSTFFFHIPYADAENEMATPESKEITAPFQKTPVVLIAEDDESNRFYLESILTKLAIKVILVTNGKEAVNQCRAHPEISLILMDLKMPVMDGFEATGAIRSFWKYIPIIAITAFAMSDDKKRALDAGCDDYLPKPVNREDLIEKLKRYGLAV